MYIYWFKTIIFFYILLHCATEKNDNVIMYALVQSYYFILKYLIIFLDKANNKINSYYHQL